MCWDLVEIRRMGVKQIGQPFVKISKFLVLKWTGSIVFFIIIRKLTNFSRQEFFLMTSILSCKVCLLMLQMKEFFAFCVLLPFFMSKWQALIGGWSTARWNIVIFIFMFRECTLVFRSGQRKSVFGEEVSFQCTKMTAVQDFLNEGIFDCISNSMLFKRFLLKFLW